MPAPSNKYIYKTVDAEHWKNAQREENLPPLPIDITDGYMHFSTASQLAKTLELYFAGQVGVMILAVEASPLKHHLKWEPSRGGDLFPHVYGDLPMDAIVAKQAIDIEPSGQCDLPGFVV